MPTPRGMPDPLIDLGGVYLDLTRTANLAGLIVLQLAGRDRAPGRDRLVALARTAAAQLATQSAAAAQQLHALTAQMDRRAPSAAGACAAPPAARTPPRRRRGRGRPRRSDRIPAPEPAC